MWPSWWKQQDTLVLFLSLSIPSLEMWAASPPLSSIGLGLGLERGEVGLAVASLGEGNGPLRMVLMDGT